MSWRVVNLGELIDEFSFRPSDLDIDASSLEFYGVSNVNGIIPTKNAAENKAENYKILGKNCFAYNPYRINVGSIALLEDDITGLISPAYVVFKPKPKSIIPQLLLMFLKSPEGLRQIKIYARGTVRQALRFADLCKIELSLPDYDEQIEFFKKIKETENTSKMLTLEFTHQLDLVKKLRLTFLREAIQGKLVPQIFDDEPAFELLKKIKAKKERMIKDKVIRKPKTIPPIVENEIPFNIPVNWVWCRLGEFAYITSGSTPKSSAFVDNGVPFLKMYNLRDQKIDFQYKQQFINKETHNGSLKRCRAFPGDLIMNIVGPPLGKLAIIPCYIKECNFNQAAVLIRPTILEINKYLFWYLSEMSEINAVETKGVAGQNNISVTQTHDMKIPLPPLSEQQRIVAKLKELMKFCDSLEVGIKKSQNQNNLLLKQVLSEALGLKIQKIVSQNKASKTEQKTSKFDPNSTLMEIVELLKKHGKLHAEELWKMSKYPHDIDAFYAELKNQIELSNTVKESKEKGYLELA